MPSARSVLLTVLIMVEICVALPFGKLDPKLLDNPDVVAEFDGLRELGVDDPRSFLAGIFEGVQGLATAREWVVAPVMPVHRWTETGQSWALFAYPWTEVRSLRVLGHSENGSRTLYQAFGEDWQSGVFRHRRVRGIYDGACRRGNKKWKRFVDWVAQRAFEDHADLKTVVVSCPARTTHKPGEPWNRTRDRRREVRHR